jgi:ribonuclease E
MLIDATHPEETRVVVLNGNRLEEFDFETSTKKQIKGNIYLAKITRVEPSLQAAFVEYGGNRHGFLAFSEIHPDYYRIPVSDREAMMAEERAAHDADDHDNGYGGNGHVVQRDDQPDYTVEAYEHHHHDDDAHGHEHDHSHEHDHGDDHGHEPAAEAVAHEPDAAAHQATGEGLSPATHYAPDDAVPDFAGEPTPPADETASGEPAPAEVESTVTSVVEVHDEAVPVETVGGDEFEEVQARPRVRHYRNYKIQEVIKRRQIILIQVTKEERGNKGAALTTYLSLAGRYCVLMPNAGRGGGVSRKITSAADRRRLKELMEELEVPDGMGIIVRTAGSERSKAEIKRDYEYLLRLWDDIRELTLRSSAPALIYEEGNLIKRAIRDLYSRDMEEILVEGEDGYRTAKEFMRMLMPSHSARVKAYRDPAIPLLHRFQVDSQIDQIHNPVVQLRSGGYIVINPTEALVSIDVNSGRATKERNIEETATKTNLEAAEEIARQLRLRDLAGLVVIDFIDMEETRNQKAVEGRLKDAMKTDRARIQLGRISAFGLLELSRQRLRSSLIEASTQPCPHCNGTGTIRSTESTALVVLRALEEEGIRRRTAEVTIYVPTQIALYVLNQKRDALSQIEARYGFHVTVAQDDSLIPPAFRLERVRVLTPQELAALPVPTLAPVPEEEEEEEYYDEEAPESAEAEVAAVPGETAEARAEGEANRRKRRRRKRRRPGDEHAPHESQAEFQGAEGDSPAAPEEGDAEDEEQPAEEGEEQGEAGFPAGPPGETAAEAAERKRRRRGKRGGRRRRREDEVLQPGAEPVAAAAPVESYGDVFVEEYPSVLDYARDGREHLFDETDPAPVVAVAAPEAPSTEVAPIALAAVEATIVEPAAESKAEATAEEAKPKRRRVSRKKPVAAEAEAPAAVEAAPVESPAEAAPAEEDAKPKRRRVSRKKPVAGEAEAPAAVEAAPVESPAEPEPVEPVFAETAEPEPVAAEPVAEPEPAAPEPVAVEPEPESDPNRPRKTGWWKRLMS